MNNIEQIVTELMSVDSNISTYALRLQRERKEIIDTMNKAQSTFGDQQAGQSLVTTLYRILQNLVTADDAIYSVRQKIQNFIHNIRK